MTFEKWWKDYGKDRDSCEYTVAKDAFKAGQEAGDEKIADIKANCDLAIEGRDVKIMELEQENNKLLDVINNQDVKIADLEKENAELKNFINAPLTKGRRTTRKEFYQTVWDLSKQLTKAKKIIKELLDFDFLPDVEIKKQAEQFLKDLEK